MPYVGVILYLFAIVTKETNPSQPAYLSKKRKMQLSKTFWCRITIRSGSFARKIFKILNRAYLEQARPKGLFRAKQRYRYYNPTKTRHQNKGANRACAKETYCVLSWHANRIFATTATYDTDSFCVAVDNCSSKCLTNCRTDCVAGTIKPCNVMIKGIAGVAKCSEQGTVDWRVADDTGKIHHFLVPNTPICTTLPGRILSPQHWAQALQARGIRTPYSKVGCWTSATHVTLEWGPFRKTIPLDRKSNVALLHTVTGHTKYTSYVAALAQPDLQPICFAASFTALPSDPAAEVTDDDDTVERPTPPRPSVPPPPSELGEKGDQIDQPINFNDQPTAVGLHQTWDSTLNNDEDEMYRTHVKLGHLSFAKIRALATKGELPKRLATCKAPMCAACQYGKMTRVPWRTKALETTHLKTVTGPGQCVSVDQVESRTVGLVAQLKGKLTTSRYTTATIFVDHYSRMGYVHLQMSTSSEDTLRAKQAFERFAGQHGATIQHYHADNGRFVDNAWIQDLAKHRQTITYCGVNAHFQNGIAERRIRDLKEQTRTMLLHAQHRWPDAISTALWPYAMRQACEIFNVAPHLQGEHKGDTPYRLFTGIDVSPEMRHYHTFGCPTYVLDNDLQQGKGILAWMSRARVGINLGLSPTHARSVSLVLSLRTGLASPQFHVKHDDLFETTIKRAAGVMLPKSQWQTKAGLTATAETTVNTKRAKKIREVAADETTVPNREPTISEPPSVEDKPRQEQTEEPDDEESLTPSAADSITPTPPGAQQSDPVEIEQVRTRAGRTIRPTQRMRESYMQRAWACWSATTNEDTKRSDQYAVFENREYEIQQNAADPLCFAATADPDTMYLHQAMKEPDKAQFLQAMKDEVESHLKNKHFVIIKREAVPKGVRVLGSVWAMKRKRRILTREVYKWKARLNVHGGQQELGVNYWETYAPVVNWSSLRMFLVISILQGWHTRQIDFVLAYPQADSECDLYMEIPRGFHVNGDKKGYVLLLKKNIYGSKQAGRVWNKHMDKGLRKIGFIPSIVDPCVYYRNKTIFMVYVDDGIFAGPDKVDINQCIQLLAKEFNLTDEGSLTDYLGVLVEAQPDGTIKLSQPHLIEQILNDLWFTERTKTKPTPAPAGRLLTRDQDAEAMADDFHYRSVVGKLNFLEKSTRPDISVAVHQCARFSADPKQSHADAVRYVGRYLQGTKDRGIIMRPDDTRSFECYADADFCGQYDPYAEDKDVDAQSARSRTGFVITYAGCPILWASKMQTETAMSTTEAEYIAISEAFRSLLPMMDLVDEARAAGVPIISGTPVVRCKAFEDNSGALALARLPKIRPRTKHINVKYHHFREAVASGRVNVVYVETENQLADTFTKATPRDLFERLRSLLIGW